jgi:hypothetical protein
MAEVPYITVQRYDNGAARRGRHPRTVLVLPNGTSRLAL